MTGVLVLNASYEPLHIVDYRRAVSLLVGNKVEIVEPGNGKVIASATLRIAIPSVIKLRRYVNAPRRHATWSRHNVLVRDHYTCQYCGARLTEREATIDHVVPQWKCKATGQPANTWTNTVTACKACQSRKGGRALHDAGMRFNDPTFEPRRPRTHYLVLSSDIVPEWRQYIEI
jgi:5-methylcytosine-specific restriction endonuclease McrA